MQNKILPRAYRPVLDIQTKMKSSWQQSLRKQPFVKLLIHKHIHRVVHRNCGQVDTEVNISTISVDNPVDKLCATGLVTLQCVTLWWISPLSGVYGF
jgi:hypothetical protein